MYEAPEADGQAGTVAATVDDAELVDVLELMLEVATPELDAKEARVLVDSVDGVTVVMVDCGRPVKDEVEEDDACAKGELVFGRSVTETEAVGTDNELELEAEVDKEDDDGVDEATVDEWDDETKVDDATELAVVDVDARMLEMALLDDADETKDALDRVDDVDAPPDNDTVDFVAALARAALVVL